MSRYVDLPVAQIDRNPDQPRKLFDQDALNELAASLRELGLLEPLIVRPTGDRYLLVAGERRWRASQIAGLEEVPCRVMDLDDLAAFRLSVAENVNRQDMTVMEEAEAYATLLAMGESVDDVARTFGKRRDMVEARLLLLHLEPHIRAMVEGGTMGALLAWHVAKLQPGNQRIVAQRWARGELDASSAVEFAAALLDAEQQVGFFDIAEPTEEERVEHRAAARKAASVLDRIERLSELLGDLAAADPEQVASALGNDVARRLASVERIGRQVRGAHATLRKAQAVSQARKMAVAENRI